MTSLIKIPFANSGDKTAVPETDVGGGVNMTQGYGQAYSLDPATDPSAKRIERDKMNWLFNIITKAIHEIQISGVAPFITSADNGGSPFSYGKGALISLDGVNYQSLENTNTTTPPGAKWSAVPANIQPLDATLTALAALVGAANKLPYFNGADTAALTDLTQVGRDIIGKSDIAAVLTYLGLTNAIIGDGAKQAGFELDRITSPYMKHETTNTVVRLATQDYADVAANLAAETVKGDVTGSVPSNMNTLEKISAALDDDAGFILTMRAALATKQPQDATLSNLSGKDAAAIRAFLSLKSAALRDVGAGDNQIPDMNGFTSSLTSPGWQKLPSGLIIQLGTANPSATGEVTIMFPVAFSEYPLYMGFGAQQVSLPNVVQSPVISAPTLNNTGCGVRNLMIGTGGGIPVASMSSFFWIALGK